MKSLTSLRHRLLAILAGLGLATGVLAEPAQTLRIGYQKFNSVNILKGTGPWRRPSPSKG